eukprot:1394330-Rhodomonas_salina.3
MGARWWWGGVWRRWGCASNFDNASARPLPLTLARLDPRSFRNEIRLARTESVGELHPDLLEHSGGGAGTITWVDPGSLASLQVSPAPATSTLADADHEQRKRNTGLLVEVCALLCSGWVQDGGTRTGDGGGAGSRLCGMPPTRAACTRQACAGTATLLSTSPPTLKTSSKKSHHPRGNQIRWFLPCEPLTVQGLGRGVGWGRASAATEVREEEEWRAQTGDRGKRLRLKGAKRHREVTRRCADRRRSGDRERRDGERGRRVSAAGGEESRGRGRGKATERGAREARSEGARADDERKGAWHEAWREEQGKPGAKRWTAKARDET